MRVERIARGLALGGAAVVLGLMTAAPATAAEPGFCRDYAATAVRQFHAAFDVPRCRMGMNGPQWSPEFHVHYDWCLGAPYRAANEQQGERARYIYACR